MKSFLSRRDRIILTAIEVIDELGVNSLSLREIADRQGISDSAIYKHFTSKDEIILGVLDYYSRFDRNLINTIRESNYTPKEGIFLFIKSMVDAFEVQPALSAIMYSFEILRSESSIVKKVKSIIAGRLDFIEELIKKGQADGTISHSFESQELADTILGIKITIILRWRISNYNFPLAARVEKALKTLLGHC